MQKRNFQTVAPEAPAMFSLALLDEHTATDETVIKGMKVFRVGTFTDSLGRKATWTAKDLADMVKHFETLRTNGILPNVPVRADHTSTVKDIVGWFAALRVEGDFLVADVEFTEPDALSKYNRGTYRNKSIEIGTYETNDGEKYNPVVLGLAFVDIPAVEGLFRHPSAPQGTPETGDKSPANGEPSNHQGASMTGKNTNQAPAGDGDNTTPPPAQHAAPPAQPFVFRISGGTEVSDFAAVQAHITRIETENAALETFRTETIEASRLEFVAGLARDGKITNPQVEQFQALAKDMSAAQFDQFKAGWEAAPKVNVLGTHSTGSTGTGDAADPAQQTAAEIETLEEIVANHRRRGATQEEIENTASFKRLQTLKKTTA